MKNSIFLFLLLLVAGCAKKEKEKDCTMLSYRVASPVSFAVFAKADLDTVIISYFNPDHSFTSLIRIDTIVDTSIIVENGNELYSSKNASGAFAWLGYASDIQIYLPALNERFQLYATYTRDTIYHYKDVTCRDRRSYNAPDEIHITRNGIPMSILNTSNHGGITTYLLVP